MPNELWLSAFSQRIQKTLSWITFLYAKYIISMLGDFFGQTRKES